MLGGTRSAQRDITIGVGGLRGSGGELRWRMRGTGRGGKPSEGKGGGEGRGGKEEWEEWGDKVELRNVWNYEKQHFAATLPPLPPPPPHPPLPPPRYYNKQ
jgi:hypothetical protein